MTQALYDNILAWTYLLAWVVTLIWYQRRNPEVDAGSAIIGTYILYAVFSLISLNDTLFSDVYNPLRLFPYIYLYGMMMVALAPVIYNHLNPSSGIDDPNTRILKVLAAVSIVCALFLLPEIITNFSSGFVKLFTDVDAGYENYQEQAADNGESGQKIRNLPAFVYNTMSDITIFLFFYFLSLRKKSKLLIIGMAFSIAVSMALPIIRGSRGSVIMTTLTVIGAYMLFRRYLSKRLNRAIMVMGLAGLIAVALPVGAITVSRFGNLNGGIFGFLSWYVGQGSLYFNNYALDVKEIRNGDRTISLFKRVIDPSTPLNYTDQRDKNHNMEVNDNWFTTFVGDFVLDFGPILAVIIFLVFNGCVLTAIRPRDGTIKLHQCLLLYFCVCVCMQGGMALFSYSYTGNLRIIAMFMLYAYLRYHEALLERFPLLSSQQKDNSHEEEN